MGIRAELEGLRSGDCARRSDRACGSCFGCGFDAAVDEALAIVARFEHERQERSAAKLASMTAAGKRTGGDLPYGHELAPDGETLRECAKEQKVIAAARRLRAEGHSLREIANQLQARQMLSRKGERFHAAQIARMIHLTRSCLPGPP